MVLDGAPTDRTVTGQVHFNQSTFEAGELTEKTENPSEKTQDEIEVEVEDPIDEEGARLAKEVLEEVLAPRLQAIFVPFRAIEEDEVIMKSCQFRQDGPCKLQAVLLPFASDQGGVKLGFKSIMLARPTFQNELVHFDLGLDPNELD